MTALPPRRPVGHRLRGGLGGCADPVGGDLGVARAVLAPAGGDAFASAAFRGVELPLVVGGDEEFPAVAVGVAEPDFVLHGVAAGGGGFLFDVESGGQEAFLGLGDLVGALELDAHVGDEPAGGGFLVLVEGQVQWRVFPLEFYLVDAPLGGGGGGGHPGEVGGTG